MKAQSLEEAKRLLKKNPKDPAVNRIMGRFCLEEGIYKDAVKYFQLSTMFSPRSLTDAIIDFEEYLLKDPENVQARLSLVDFHLSQGDIESSLIELEELVEIAPETAQIYNLLGRIYLKLGRIDGAITLLEKAMDAGKGDAVLLESLASAYIEKERFADAIMLYERLLQSVPASKRVLRMLSEMYIRLSNYDSAAQKLIQMLTDDPEMSSEIRGKLKELANLSPESSFIKEQLAEAYIRSMKPDQAVDQLRTVLDLAPEKLDQVIAQLRRLLLTYPDERPAMFLLAQSLTNKGMFSEAVELYSQIQQLDPSMLERCIKGYKTVISAYPNQAMAHQYLADALFQKGSLKEALQEYGFVLRLCPGENEQVEKKCREILKQDPEMLEACLVLAESFMSGGESRKAITLSEELVAKDKKNLGAYRVLGEAYMKLDILGRAKEAFQSALKLKPLDPDLKDKFQRVCEKEMDQEISQIKAKIEQDPWRIGLNFDLAKLLQRRGSLDAAIRSLQNAVRDTTKASMAHNLMGTIFKETGRFDLAQVQFEKAIEFKGPEETETEKRARANIGSCMEAYGKIPEALNIYESLLSSDIEFGNLSSRVKYLNDTNPSSIRNKSLAVITAGSGFNEIRAFCGRDGRRIRGGDEDLTMLSFGQGQNNQGIENFMRERIKASEEDFTLSTQLDSRLFVSYNNLGVVCLKDREIERAADHFLQALSEDPGNPVYHNNLGVCYLMKGDLDKAEAEFVSALKSDKSFNAGNINLGDVLMKKDQVKEAIGHYSKVGAFDPLFETAIRRMNYWIVQ